jgi:phenylalanyl-tRNA synthetase beta chain
VSRLLGVRVPASEQARLLARVGVGTEPIGEGVSIPVIAGEAGLAVDPETREGALVAIVPSHRRDLVIEADIAEEVARVRGYETLPGRLPDTPMPGSRPDPRRLVDTIRELLAGRGLAEAVTHALIAPEDHARLGIAPDDPRTIVAENPVSVEHSQLRRSLLPGMLRVLADNERQRRDDVAIFELGPLHAWSPTGPTERPTLGLLLAGAASPPSPDAPARSVDLGDAKGLVEWLVERLGGGPLRYEPGVIRDGVDHPRRTASVVGSLPDGERLALGTVGELDPRLLAHLDVRAERVVVAEVDLEALARLAPSVRRADHLERLPAAERDLAVVVDQTTPAGEVLAVVRESGGSLLRTARLFDRYQGPPLGEHEVSLAVRLRFEPVDRPIADGELDAAVDEVARALKDRLGARRRD